MTKLQTVVSTFESLTPSEQDVLADLLLSLTKVPDKDDVFYFTDEEMALIDRRLENIDTEATYTVAEVFSSI
jgi:hypothetical protein